MNIKFHYYVFVDRKKPEQMVDNQLQQNKNLKFIIVGNDVTLGQLARSYYKLK